MLGHFDQFCIENGYDNGSLTRDLVMAWAEQRPTESKNYRNHRVSFVRQLALYMISLNMDAYTMQFQYRMFYHGMKYMSFTKLLTTTCLAS